MSNLTTASTKITPKFSLQEWYRRIMDCQSSGMSVKSWCRGNGISTTSSYFSSKMRESVLKEHQEAENARKIYPLMHSLLLIVLCTVRQ